MKPLFCEMTSWWNWYYIRNQISPHFFYYPIQLMTEKGFNAEVLTILHPERRESKYEVNENLVIHRIENNSFPLLSMRLLRHLLRKNYSLVHLHDINWLADSASWLASKMKRTPMVYTSHAHYQLARLLESKSQIPFMRERIIRRLLVGNSEKHVFVAFTDVQAKAYNRIGIKRIEVIPHGIDMAPFNVERDKTIDTKYKLGDPNILCVGSIEPRKGQHFLVRSMPKILKEYTSAKLLLVGRVYNKVQLDYLNLLQSEIRRLNLKDKVLFVDDLCRNDLIQLYLSSSVFALPSQAEMFGLVFLEAMAAGLPIVTINKPHIAELLGNGNAGILVKREQESIESALLNVLEDKKLQKNLNNNGLRLIQQKYRLDRVIQQLWNLYQKLIND